MRSSLSSLVSSRKVQMVTKGSVSLKSKFGETSITVKHNTKLKLLHVRQIIDPKISLYSECMDDVDVWSKKFCFKKVSNGVNKLVSKY